jgi:uncharacterized phage protein (TIGR02220 family)
MSQQGFIMLHRKVQQHWLYDEKRKFSKFEAWVDMLMMANHKANKFVLGNELISLEKGQFVTSELKLMERWDWGKAKLRSFLELLESDGMIVKKSDRKKTTITICNYSIYHGFETDNRPQSDREQTAGRPQSDYNQTDNRLITDTNNNENNDNKDIIVEIVNYLNDVCSKKFKPSTEGQVKFIRARLNDGYEVEDLKQVIDTKAAQWLGTDSEKYLRPSTLFNSEKFEGYLNEKSTPKKQEAPAPKPIDPNDVDPFLLKYAQMIKEGEKRNAGNS